MNDGDSPIGEEDSAAVASAEAEEVETVHERCDAFASLAASVGAGAGLAFGVAIGVLSGALPDLRRSMDLNAWEQGYVVASVGIGGIPGALLGGWFADLAGRKWAVVVQSACFVIAALIAALAPSLPFLIFGQLWMGAGAALSQLANVAWINEAVPAHRRGGAIAAYELCVTIGVFLAFLTNEVLVLSNVAPEVSWRLLFASMSILPLANIAAIVPLPESPMWLLSRGKRAKATRALSRALAYNRRCEHLFAAVCARLKRVFTGRDSVDTSVEWADGELLEAATGGAEDGVANAMARLELKLVIEKGNGSGSGDAAARAERVAALPHCARIRWRLCEGLAHAGEWKVSLAAVLGLIFFSQATGGLVVRVHASDIMQSAGIPRELASAAITVLGLVKVLSTALVVVLLDKVGRRPFLLIGVAVMLCSAATLALVSALSTAVALQDSDFAAVVLRLLLVFACWTWTAAYQLSFGPVQFAVGAELFPSEIRGRFLGLQICFNSLLQAVVFQAFPVVTGAFEDVGTGHAVAFGLHACVSIVAGAFFYSAIVETTGLSPSALRTSLSRLSFWKPLANAPRVACCHAMEGTPGGGAGAGAGHVELSDGEDGAWTSTIVLDQRPVAPETGLRGVIVTETGLRGVIDTHGP